MQYNWQRLFRLLENDSWQMYNFRLLRSTISTVFKRSIFVGLVSSAVYERSFMLEAAVSIATHACFFKHLFIFFSLKIGLVSFLKSDLRLDHFKI